MISSAQIAYFSMEIALHPEVPTYAGGLGILAGDTLRSAADMKLPMCAVSLLHRKGYFRQRLDESGWQFEENAAWDISQYLDEIEGRVSVRLDGRDVQIRCWKYEMRAESGGSIPVYLLDTDLEENLNQDRTLTDLLYQGDAYHKMCQELILGQGGVRMLRELGHCDVRRFHLNEGHAAFLGMELLYEEMKHKGEAFITDACVHTVRKRCVFTTHTPVPAGHDQFSMDLVNQVLGHQQEFLQRGDLYRATNEGDGCLNMTYLALNLSHYVNGVAKKHAEVSRLMFADYEIDSITNGVHVGTWMSPSLKTEFDRYLMGWRSDSFHLRYAMSLPKEDIWRAHQAAKGDLLDYVKGKTGREFSLDVLTLGYARRATSYKRPKLLFENLEKLYEISKQAGGLQLVFAGKAHPGDDTGKFFIQDIIRLQGEMASHGIQLVYLEDYDMNLAKLLVSGVDVWLNTPQPPLEASGTSGMKAALNGVPSLSVLDGWWIEGCIEDVTGWAIESTTGEGEANSLYDKLEHKIVPLYCQRRDGFIDVMRHSIALNGAFFHTQRMLLQYMTRAYFL